VVSFEIVFVAVIATGFFGVAVGAIKTPVGVMVPVEDEPPSTPFTFHVRLTRDPLGPDAKNCTLSPAARSPVFGATVKFAGCRNWELLDDVFPDAQPDRIMPRTSNEQKTMEYRLDKSKE
jgi:hypothetical protein